MGIFERKQKVFYRKTKKGNILKVVREHYIRDDVHCGLKNCSECKIEGAPLEVLTVSKSKTFQKPHHLLINIDVAINQIDLLSQDAITNVIIPQTVIQEVRYKSLAIHKRLRDLIETTSKHFFIFSNEHHKECYIEREVNESVEERNERAVRLVGWWYAQHFDSHQQNIVLITDNKKNIDKARELELNALTTREYVESLTDHPELLDIIAHSDDGDGSCFGSRNLFTPHLSIDDIRSKIKSSKIIQGVLKMSRNNFLEGNVIAGEDNTILIQGRNNLNRALNDDIVAIELLPKTLWSAPSTIFIDQESEEKNKDAEDNSTNEKEEEELLTLNASEGEKLPTGKVVGIIRRKWRQYCGILKTSDIPNATRHMFIPADKKIPFIRVETRQSQLLSTKRILVAIDSWPRDSRNPKGHVVRVIGQIGEKETENEVILLEHDCPHSKFSESVLNCLPKLPWIITAKDEEERIDFRHLNICSVDPVGCTDIDDCLHAKLLPNGNFEIGVHIADVSHFIRPNTSIDKEAQNRATSVYLTNRRIDMVPQLLSTNLCSLRANQDRFAFSVVWEMNLRKASILSTRFYKSIIRSRAELTYEKAQQIIDDPHINDDISNSLRSLNKMAKKMKAKRLEAGALVLHSMEVKFHMDPDTDTVVDIVAKQHLETMTMVEEFMLLANISAAEMTLQNFPDCALLRRHPAPPKSNFDPLLAATKSQKVDLDVTSNKTLCDSLGKATREDNPFFNSMLRILTTRCMMQALYFCSSTQEKPEFYHYGLATNCYTHFTSPIRRYADIIVHRLLAVIIEKDNVFPELLDSKKCSDIAQHINYRHKMAQYAGRASNIFTANNSLKGLVNEYDAYILFLHKNAIQVLAPTIGQQLTLYLDTHIRERKQQEKQIEKARKQGMDIDMKIDKTPLPEFKFNEKELHVSCGNIILRSFDHVRIQVSIDSTDIQHEKVVTRLVEPQIAGFSVPSINGTVNYAAPPLKKIKIK